ncbi:MAG: hypothetical protein ACYTFK_06680 [Planctomycetota bacterium]
MLKDLQNFETIAHDFAPQVLVAPGVVFVVIGLCLWLGGLRWSRPTAGILGVLAGCLWAFFLTGRQAAAFISMAAVAGFFSLFFNRAALVVAGAATGVIITLIILASPMLSKKNDQPCPETKITSATERQAKGITLIQESLEVGKSHLTFLGDRFAAAVNLVPFENLAIPAIVGLVICLAGYFMPQLVGALTCSLLGTVIISLGMMLLLFYKGALPITHIYARTNIYFPVVLGMVVFGSATQMMLCSARDKKRAAEMLLSRGES